MEPTTFTRTDKETNQSTVLPFTEAVDQFIKDNHDYAQEEDGMTVEEALSDMSTVFDTRAALNELSEEDELDAGYFIYTVTK